MDELVDVGTHVVSVEDGGVALLVFEEVRRVIDIAAPQVGELPAPSLPVLVQELQEKVESRGLNL